MEANPFVDGAPEPEGRISALLRGQFPKLFISIVVASGTQARKPTPQKDAELALGAPGVCHSQHLPKPTRSWSEMPPPRAAETNRGF
jgi:hypothetical protein